MSIIQNANYNDALYSASHEITVVVLLLFQLAVSSDKVMDLNEPLLTLNLHTSEERTDGQDICVEMTASQVDNLLHKLKEAQGTLAHLSSQGPS